MAPVPEILLNVARNPFLAGESTLRGGYPLRGALCLRRCSAGASRST